jgi:hypothetical protein
MDGRLGATGGGVMFQGGGNSMRSFRLGCTPSSNVASPVPVPVVAVGDPVLLVDDAANAIATTLAVSLVGWA